MPLDMSRPIEMVRRYPDKVFLRQDGVLYYRNGEPVNKVQEARVHAVEGTLAPPKLPEPVAGGAKEETKVVGVSDKIAPIEDGVWEFGDHILSVQDGDPIVYSPKGKKITAQQGRDILKQLGEQVKHAASAVTVRRKLEAVAKMRELDEHSPLSVLEE